VVGAAEAVRRMLDELPLGGHVLEFTRGTGIWTVYLTRRASQITVLDASPAMIAISRAIGGREKWERLEGVVQSFPVDVLLRYRKVNYALIGNVDRPN
jgi:ubiquinone/menaquinone biosynthesis C-methylase UbiE